ncbi:hypothetical protein [Bacillus kwashiorkori]|uniref:hypothetical protein n=1 Tax=Bacillus kwashiorkori TaxID=1522318 RepID=UPI0007827E81|nr:hypothetical protein [Bacillus kwashiorkori]
MEKILHLILEKLDALDQRVSGLEQEQKRQADLLHQLINTVAATNVKLSDTNSRLDKLEDKVDELSVDVKEIKNSMATKKDLEYYDQMISEHSREIYKLKNK